MNKPISRKAHGVTDYLYIPFTALAPELIGFGKNKKAATLSRVLSATILTSTLFTRAEWGLFKKMPYQRHLLLDTLAGATALAAPFLFGFAKNTKARNTFFALAVFGLAAGLLSRPEEMPETNEATDDTEPHWLPS